MIGTNLEGQERIGRIGIGNQLNRHILTRRRPSSSRRDRQMSTLQSQAELLVSERDPLALIVREYGGGDELIWDPSFR